MSIILRRAIANDFYDINLILIEENRYHADLIPEIFKIVDPVITENWLDEIILNPDEELFVCVANDKVVGVVLIASLRMPDNTELKPRKYVYVDEIAVKLGYRGRGIGKKLMQRVHEWAVEMKIDEIELNVWEANKLAIDFYERLGYHTLRRGMRYKLNDNDDDI